MKANKQLNGIYEEYHPMWVRLSLFQRRVRRAWKRYLFTKAEKKRLEAEAAAKKKPKKRGVAKPRSNTVA